MHDGDGSDGCAAIGHYRIFPEGKARVGGEVIEDYSPAFTHRRARRALSGGAVIPCDRGVLREISAPSQQATINTRLESASGFPIQTTTSPRVWTRL